MNEIVEGILQAVSSGRTDIVRTVISTFKTGEIDVNDNFNLDILLNKPITSDGTLLHVASKSNKSDIVRALLMAGADPCVQNNNQKTPLDLASSIEVQHVFNDQLLQCIAQSDIGLLCQLLASGVNINLKDSPTSQNTPLHWAACYGTKDVVECLCSRGANVTSKNSDGATPLHDAVIRGQADVIKVLLMHGASSLLYTKAHSCKKYAGKSPIELAMDKPDVINLFQNHSDKEVINGISNMAFHNDIQADKTSDSETASIVPAVPTDLNAEHECPGLANGSAVVLGSEPGTPAWAGEAASEQAGPDTPGLSANSKLDESFASVNSSQVLSAAAEGGKSNPLHYLWPKPKKLVQKEGKHFKPSGGVLPIFLHCEAQPDLAACVLRVWRAYEENFSAFRVMLHLEVMTGEQRLSSPHLVAEVNPRLFSAAHSYCLLVQHSMVKVQAKDIAGLHYAIATLLQLFRMYKDEGIPNIQIYDFPDVRDRGIILDMSKGRVPQMSYMKNLVKTASLLKINQIHIYNRFCIPKDPAIKWQFPYSRSSMLELADFCQSHCIELIPVVDLTPRVSIDDLDILYAAFQSFLTCFISASFVGIGPRLSSFLVDITDEGELNLEDTERFLPIQSHQTLQLCAFVFHDTPKMLAQYPCNMALAEYGFQANYDFERYGKEFAENCIPFYHVPGTAAWNSLAGCPEAAVRNICGAVASVRERHGLGVMVSHWSGVSHLTHLPMMWPGVVIAAGLTWNSTVELDYIPSILAQLLNRHVFKDSAGIAGQVIMELGRAETYLLRCARNQAGNDNSNLPAEKGSTLYQLLTHPDLVDLENLTIDIFQKTMRHIRKCQSELSRASLQCSDGAVILSELQVTADLMLTACRVGRQLVNVGKNPVDVGGCTVVNMGVSNLSPTAKTDLANRLLSQIETYRSVWLSRNLPQGLQDSMLILSTMLKQFVPEEGIETD